TIENDLIACLKELRDKAESYAAGTIEALNDTVSDIKIVIEQAQAMQRERERSEVAHLSPAEFAGRMGKDIEARRKGGPNLQAKYLELAEQLPEEIIDDCRRSVVEVWGKVEEELAKRKREEAAAKEAADFVELRRRMKRRFAEHEEASSFLPARQPPADDAQKGTEEEQEVAPTLVPVSPR